MYDAVSKKDCGKQIFSNVIVRHGESNIEDIRKQPGFLGWEDPRRRAWQPTPVFFSGESH